MNNCFPTFFIFLMLAGCHLVNEQIPGETGGQVIYHTGLNPVIREGSADPSVRVFNDTVYVYPSHDFSRENDYWIMKDWKVYSTTDLVNFTDHGVALSGSEISWAVEPDHCWAPDCIEKNGRYYFYFPMADARGVWKGEIGVATGNTPAGPFREALGKPLVAAGDRPEGYEGFFFNIDPAAYTDEDGRSYLFWGNGACFIAELSSEMTSFSSGIRQVRIEGHQGYAEGPFVWKRNGTYYLLYSQGGGSARDRLDYATSDRVDGPYRYRGTIIAHGRKGNIHGSVFQYNGQWYVAYHDLFPTDKYRMTCIDRIHYRENGDIVRVEPSREGVGWYNAGERIEAEDYFEGSTRAACRNTDQEGFFLSGMGPGDWLRYSNVKLPFGFSGDFTAMIRNPGGEQGSLTIMLDGPDGTRAGDIQLDGGAMNSWTEIRREITPIQGSRDLYLILSGQDDLRIDMDWIRLN